MNQGPRRFVALAALAIPLLALAIFGSAELGRQTERADRALADQAGDFLREVERELDGTMLRTDRLLGSIPDLGRTRAAAASRALRAADGAALDLLILDADGGLLFPRPAPRELDSLPFQRPSSLSAIRLAEALELLGDEDGARQRLRGVVEQLAGEGTRFVGRENVALRAHFALAGLLRRSGDLDGAEEHYLIALVEAFGPTSRRSDRDASRATVGLWCELALAEIDTLRGRGAGRALDLAREIADGVHDAVGEPMLQAALDTLEEVSGPDPGGREAFQQIRGDDRLRQVGRAFAAEYGALLRESVRRRLERATDGRRSVTVVHAGANGAQILVLRPAEDRERRATLDDLDGAAWVGVRMDLDQLLAEAIAERLASDSGPFVLGVSDAEGTPIAPPIAGEAPTLETRAEITTDDGIRLFATPIDLDALVAERRRTIRNRALLFLLLCVSAGGGALVLMRSVARESELATLKIALVSRVTHDLKTPLALIRMYAETIGRGRARTQDETARFAGIVQREADVLTRMVERILDFSRKETGTLTYAPRRVELGESLDLLTDAFRPHVEARRMLFEVELPEAELWAEVDPGAFESAVLDLLENATKYTTRDAAEAEVRLRARVDGGLLRIEVEDRGIGIPDAEREKVFESFIRGSNAGEARGSGLGLSLVRHFARAHGGEIRALPRAGGGTTMELSLPLAGPAPTPSEATQHST
jgi:signal transduction histidine kinase